MKLVEVIWSDAEEQSKEGWLNGLEIEEFEKKDTIVRSVGYLKSKTDKYLTLVGDWALDPEEFGTARKIPIQMIKEVRDLSYAGG